MKLDHVGIAVSSIEAALEVYGLLGLRALERGPVEAFNVEVCTLDAGEVRLELIAPLGPGAVQRFLDGHGSGLHHVAFVVSDLQAELGRLQALGARLVDKKPRPGFGGHLVAFVHPQSANGVLTELVQAGA